MVNKRTKLIIYLFLTAVLYSCQFVGEGSGDSGTDSSGRWVVWSQVPSVRWEDAFVTGNGRHGTMVWGTPNDERIICVHEELFIRGWDHNKETVPVTAPLLPEVRRLIDERKNNQAAWLIAGEADRQLREMGANNPWPLIPHPAFDLHIQYLDTSEFVKEKYCRQLDLETGVASVFNKNVIESVFSSRKHNVNVVRLKAGAQEKINVMLGLEETPGRHGIHFGHDLDSAFLSVEQGATPGWLTYRAAYSKDPGGYEGLARVTLKGGKMECDGKRLIIRDAEEVLMLVRITPLNNSKELNQQEACKVLAELPDDYNELLSPHQKEHGEMFRRMQLDLGKAAEWKEISTDELLATVHEKGMTPLFMEQLHAMGRYLLISSSGKYPPPLQGIWGGSWNPNWIGGFVWDSNINLAVSAATMSNLPECAESYCSYVESLLPGWRLNAKNYLGCRGFIVAHYNDPENGYLTHFGGGFPWMCWPGGAGWNIRPFYEYAMLMGDDEMLEKRVLPLYREMADFYEDFMTMGKDCLFHFSPSVSPENAPVGTNTWWSKDATMDVAIAREVFGILLDMGKKFNLPQDELNKWQYYLDRLPEYRINEDGALAEWIDPTYPDVYAHRHLSHLYPVFPGSQLGKNKGDEQLIKAARVALDKRFDFDTSSAHGLLHVALQATRLGDMDKLVQNLDRFSRRYYVYNSLVTSHDPDHLIYNLDAILSLPRLFMEMLVYAEPEKIELLPMWPKDYPDGSLKGIRVFGGHTLDINWKEGMLVEAILHAKQDASYEVVYQGKVKHVQLHEGKTFHFSGNFD